MNNEVLINVNSPNPPTPSPLPHHLMRLRLLRSGDDP